METELYSRIFCALAIALVGSVVFTTVGHAWIAVGAKLQQRNPFAEHVLLEPGHRLRQNLQNLDRSYYRYLSSLLVYGLLLVVALALQSEPLPYNADAGVWQALLVLVIVVSSFLPFRALKLKCARSRLAFRRMANIAMGQALQRLASRGYNVYHDVRLGNHIVDNVVVGAKGVYAVNVFALDKKRNGNGTVRLNDSSLVFGNAKTRAPVGVSVNRVRGLREELSRVVGHPIQVRSVIAVPGWTVTATKSDKHLLVNEKTVVVLTGWTDSGNYLMDDELAQIHDYLTARCVNGKQTPN